MDPVYPLPTDADYDDTVCRMCGESLTDDERRFKFKRCTTCREFLFALAEKIQHDSALLLRLGFGDSRKGK